MNRRHLLSLPAFALAPVPARALELHGSRIDLDVSDGLPPATKALLEPWLAKCAEAVAAYYGKFPVPRLNLRIRSVPGAGVRGGQAFPGDPPTIRARVGEGSTVKHLMSDDWVMVHEMIHLAFPWMNLQHNWMAEGIAVYVESIARVQAGHLQPEQIWRDFVMSMPKGLPRAGDGGLEQTQNWGRTYWGGALFCLFADLRIREETGGRYGLRDALRAINAKLDFRREHDFRETLAMGDAATGRKVLMTLYEEWGFAPVSPDLDRLWAELGVAMKNGEVSFDEAAPKAKLRTAITA
ncbi:MAG: M1 family metallopeptidase [Rhizobiales bacterium]|nr:M1 family metallopeptidase [Hyphomicrobiales bacterium]